MDARGRRGGPSQRRDLDRRSGRRRLGRRTDHPSPRPAGAARRHPHRRRSRGRGRGRPDHLNRGSQAKSRPEYRGPATGAAGPRGDEARRNIDAEPVPNSGSSPATLRALCRSATFPATGRRRCSCPRAALGRCRSFPLSPGGQGRHRRPTRTGAAERADAGGRAPHARAAPLRRRPRRRRTSSKTQALTPTPTPTPQIQPVLDRREVEIRRTAPGRNGSRQAVYATLTDAEPRSTAAPAPDPADAAPAGLPLGGAVGTPRVDLRIPGRRAARRAAASAARTARPRLADAHRRDQRGRPARRAPEGRQRAMQAH